MIMAASLAVLVDTFVFSELSYYTHSDILIAIGELMEISAYLLVTVAIWWQLSTLKKTQKGDENDERRVG
jgi:hypothetical protein